MNDTNASRIEIVQRQALTPSRYAQAVQLCERAYDDDDDVPALMGTFENATHVLLIDQRDCLISHALWIERWVIHSNQRIRSAYVELVATDPDHQRQGHASAVMRALGDAIVCFDIGALSPSDPAFYVRFGWELWRGQLLEQHQDGTIMRSPIGENMMILQRRGGPELDLAGPLTAPWRDGDIW